MSRSSKTSRTGSRPPRRARIRTRPLRAQLDTLEASGLIDRAPSASEIECLFRHALVQEAAYASLLKHQRRAMRQAIGLALEQIYPEQLDDLAPVLAEHYYGAEDPATAQRYYRRAGDIAAGKYALPEAIMHYGQALTIARSSRQANDAELEALFTALGRALEMNGQYPAALQLYVEMEALAVARGDRAMELGALIARATIRSVPTAAFDALDAQALGEHGLALAKQLGDRAAEAKVLWNFALLRKFSGDWTGMTAVGERAVQIARELGLRELLANALNDIYAGYTAAGKLDRAREALSEANALWRELGNLPMLSDNLTSIGDLESLLGNYDAALAYAEEAHRLSSSIHNVWNQSYALWAIGQVCLERGDIDRGIHSLQDAITLGERAGFGIARVFVRAILAIAFAFLGDGARGADFAGQAVRLAAIDMPAMKGLALCALTMVHAWSGHLSDASETLEQARLQLTDADPQSAVFLLLAGCELGIAQGAFESALTSAERLTELLGFLGVGNFLGWAYYLKGVTLQGLGRPSDAHAALTAARAVEEPRQGRRLPWMILARLSALEAARGSDEEARRLHAQAREVLEFIIAHTSAPDLRAAFLARPAVRSVLNP